VSPVSDSGECIYASNLIYAGRSDAMADFLMIFAAIGVLLLVRGLVYSFVGALEMFNDIRPLKISMSPKARSSYLRTDRKPLQTA
jgi:hypothetical protein